MSAPAANLPARSAASFAICLMLAERWRKAIRAKSLSELTERSYRAVGSGWMV